MGAGQEKQCLRFPSASARTSWIRVARLSWKRSYLPSFSKVNVTCSLQTGNTLVIVINRFCCIFPFPFVPLFPFGLHMLISITILTLSHFALICFLFNFPFTFSSRPPSSLAFCHFLLKCKGTQGQTAGIEELAGNSDWHLPHRNTTSASTLIFPSSFSMLGMSYGQWKTH